MPECADRFLSMTSFNHHNHQYELPTIIHILREKQDAHGGQPRMQQKTVDWKLLQLDLPGSLEPSIPGIGLLLSLLRAEHF